MLIFCCETELFSNLKCLFYTSMSTNNWVAQLLILFTYFIAKYAAKPAPNALTRYIYIIIYMAFIIRKWLWTEPREYLFYQISAAEFHVCWGFLTNDQPDNDLHSVLLGEMKCHRILIFLVCYISISGYKTASSTSLCLCSGVIWNSDVCLGVWGHDEVYTQGILLWHFWGWSLM